MRLIQLYVIVAVAVIVFSISQLLLEAYLNDDPSEIRSRLQEDYTRLFKEVTQPVIVWWAPLGPSYPDTVKECGQLSCYFTTDRHFHHHPRIKAFMFYGSMINFTDLPLPRSGSSLLWALLHEESPRNNAPLTHFDVLSLFNYTATFSRYSSFPLTTQYLSGLQALTDLKYYVPTTEKTRLQKDEGLAPIMYLQSDCSTPLDRDSYVAELAKYIKVDSYGACLHNKDLPLHLKPPHHLETMMGDEMLHLVAKYKFILAIENGVCSDYITEKLWRPLIAGAVPVYIGSPTVSDWLPNNNSAILGLNFESPEDLARYLHQLNTDEDEYNNHLSHKLKSEVTNSRLVQTLTERKWDAEGDEEEGSFVDLFSCFVCEKVHSSGEISIATEEHYPCPMPVSILSRAVNSSNFWLSNWFYGRCEAAVVRHFVDSRVTNYTITEYEDALKELVIKNKCHYTEDNAKVLKINI